MAEKCWAKMIVSQLWLLLSSSSGHEIHLYYRGWKRAIFFSIGKNFNNSRLPELVTLDRVGASVLSFGLNGPYPRIERCQLSGDDFCSGVVKFGGR